MASFVDSSSSVYIIPVHISSLTTIPGTGPKQAVPIYELMDKNKDFLWQREMSYNSNEAQTFNLDRSAKDMNKIVENLVQRLGTFARRLLYKRGRLTILVRYVLFKNLVPGDQRWVAE